MKKYYCKTCGKECKKDRSYCSKECRSKIKYNFIICLFCGKKIGVNVKYKNKRKYCSRSCASKHTANSRDRKKKIRNTLMKKYGVDHPAKIPNHKEKIRKTNLEKHGAENYANHEKRKDTLIKKYGSYMSPKTKKRLLERIENKEVGFGSVKYQKAIMEKYDVEYVSQNKEIKEKKRLTTQKNYGVDHPSQSDIIKNNKKKTYLKKYGVDNPNKVKEIREKTKQTSMEKYGVPCSMNLQKNKEKAKLSKHKQMYNRLLIIDVIPLFELEEYNGSHTNYWFECKQCSYKFETYLYNGHIPICRNCNPYKTTGISKAEKEVLAFVKSILPENTIILENDRTLIPPKEVDIYIPEYKIAIEYNGLYWHSEISGGKDKHYHLDKSNECFAKGVQLIHISEDEWIDKQNIVKNRLKNVFGLNKESSIYARNCIVREIGNEEKDIFLDLNHLQGKDKSSIKLGAYYNDELVSVMTFGKLRLALGQKKNEDINKHTYELYRFCSSKNVVGIAGKLFKHFIDNYYFTSVITYMDKRWNVDEINNLYTKLGFKLLSHTSPNYWYVSEMEPYRQHRFNFRKNVLKDRLNKFNPQLTEWMNMQLNDYDRIWDCGNMKFVFTKNS